MNNYRVEVMYWSDERIMVVDWLPTLDAALARLEDWLAHYGGWYGRVVWDCGPSRKVI